MTDFFRKCGREKLYKQWVEKSGLSPDDLPEDLKKQEPDSSGAGEEPGPGGVFFPKTRRSGDGSSTFVSGRLLVIMASIIAILLVVVAVLSTVLALRG